MKNTVKAIYTYGNKESKEIEFTKEEISKFGLKKVIWYHANKNKLKKYECKVDFKSEVKAEDTDVTKKVKVFRNPLNRLIHRLSEISLFRVEEVKSKLPVLSKKVVA